MSDKIKCIFGGYAEAYRTETAETTPGGQVSRGEDAIVIGILPPYAEQKTEAMEFIQFTLPEAMELAERLVHLYNHAEETEPELDENGLPLFMNPIEKSLYE